LNSVKFCDETLLSKLKNIDLLKALIDDKINEIHEYNNKSSINNNSKVNGRCLTNIGLFRQYIVEYLKRNTNISDKLTFLVRQLAPNQFGVPLEIYVFSVDQNWGNYENIQADIFDHLFASVHDFELNIFQNPTGKDILALTNNGT
jgi:miniconductance mechanosensitive channel